MMPLRLLRMVALLALTGCASSGSQSAPSATADPRTASETLVPIDSLGRWAEVPWDSLAKSSPRDSASPRSNDSDAPDSAATVTRTNDGPWRIQLLATANKDESRQFIADNKDKVHATMNIEYDAPYYKVLTGDFTAREDAEDARQALQDLGYTKAWIVRARQGRR